MKNGRPRIGVFDSGVGGLTVLNRLVAKLPNADYHYLGDTARVPYGSRSSETIIGYSRDGLNYLLGLEVDLLVIACNTSSAIALPRIGHEFSVPVLGVIEDGAAAALDAAKHGVLVLGTRATITSGIYQRLITSSGTGLSVLGLACPLFVPIVEEGWAETPVAEAAIKMYMSSCMDYSYDLILLGCTHFPIMQDTLQRIVGKHIRIEDPSIRVADRVASMLPEAGRSSAPEIHFHVTDSPDSFVNVAKAMGVRVTNEVTHVDLTALNS